MPMLRDQTILIIFNTVLRPRYLQMFQGDMQTLLSLPLLMYNIAPLTVASLKMSGYLFMTQPVMALILLQVVQALQ